MAYNIIEDCSPFYIRFTHKEIDKVIQETLKRCSDNYFVKPNGQFYHDRLTVNDAKDILSHVPMVRQFPNINEKRVSLFVSTPGLYYRAHKDGLSHRFSLNYGVRILDDKCITSWYSDVDLKDYSIDNLPSQTSRECINFDKEKHIPLKFMTANQGECVLFNTDIFHDWDNSKSINHRIVLTLRLEPPHCSLVYFEDARRILFGY